MLSEHGVRAWSTTLLTSSLTNNAMVSDSSGAPDPYEHVVAPAAGKRDARRRRSSSIDSDIGGDRTPRRPV